MQDSCQEEAQYRDHHVHTESRGPTNSCKPCTDEPSTTHGTAADAGKSAGGTKYCSVPSSWTTNYYPNLSSTGSPIGSRRTSCPHTSRRRGHSCSWSQWTTYSNTTSGPT